MDIRCSNPECNKMFAELIQGNILITPSSQIKITDDRDVAIQILCNRCKRKTSLIVK